MLCRWELVVGVGVIAIEFEAQVCVVGSEGWKR